MKLPVMNLKTDFPILHGKMLPTVECVQENGFFKLNIGRTMVFHHHHKHVGYTVTPSYLLYG